MFDWYLKVVKEKYADFSGRAGRPEFWYFVLANVLISIGLAIVDGILGTKVGGSGILGGIYSLAILVPSIAVGVRRLHDTDRSGWWILIGLIPLIGAIVLIIFYVQEGTPGTNEYGPNPAETASDDISSHLVE